MTVTNLVTCNKTSTSGNETHSTGICVQVQALLDCSKQALQVIESVILFMSEKTQSNIELINISKLLTALLLHTLNEAMLGIEGFHLATTTDAKFKQRQLNHKAKIHASGSHNHANQNKLIHCVALEHQDCWCT